MTIEFIDLLTWGWKIFSGIVTFLVLAFIGVSRKILREHLAEHKKVVDYVNNKTSESAGELKVKKDQDWHDVVEMLKKLDLKTDKVQHDVNQGRQQTSNLQIMLKAKGLI